jgi:hypothetical protein
VVVASLPVPGYDARMDLRERGGDAEVRHPWELARRRFVLQLLRRHGVLASARRVLDVGSGDAWMSGEVKRALSAADAELVAWDSAYTPGDLATLRDRGLNVTTSPPQGRFDLVLMLDVLEHVVDDRALLAEVVRDHTAAGATVLVTVPAWPQVTSGHDEALLHQRRYTHASARGLLAGAGLDIVVSGGLFHGLLLRRAAAALAEKLADAGRDRPHGVGHWRGGRAITSLITSALALESRGSLALAARGLDVPGLSFFALCARRA